jgi:uncharacterized protein (DUF849 family)
MLQVCLNGSRRPDEHPALPVSPGELAAAARDAVAAGATDIHVHPRDARGVDSLDPDVVATVLDAVRAAVPGIGVGVTTGAWIEPDPARRAALVASWEVRPDHASVNWHEPGADVVAAALLERGVGVEAGIFSGTDAARRYLDSPLAPRVLRVLAEVTDADPGTAADTAAVLLRALGVGAAGRARTGVPVLLHGEDSAAWPVLTVARRLGLATRVGLEDVVVLPDGTAARDNAALVAAARLLA